MTDTYANPWHRDGKGSGPATYTTDATPRRVDDVLIYHRVPGGPGKGCWDYVRNGVCFAQRAGLPRSDAAIRAIIAEAPTPAR